MIADLIKLSKELYELDMVEESISIDEMIEKLYGSGIGSGDTSSRLLGKRSEEDETSLRDSFAILATNEEFLENLASIIKEYCDEEDINSLNNLLGEQSE